MKSTMVVPYFKCDLDEMEISEVTDTLKSGWIGSGPKTIAFEQAFAEYDGVPYAVATNSCTSALHLAVAAFGAGPGDGVLVPTHTWISSAEAVLNQGAVPILVDCDATYLAMDLADAADKITLAETGELPVCNGESLRVVGMIHVYYAGMVMNETYLRKFADMYGLWWVTDAAHAFSAKCRKPDGTWLSCGAGQADVYCYSFYPNKPITKGEGGMVVTSKSEIAEWIRTMSNHGLSFDTWEGEATKNWDKQVVAKGYKYTMSDIQASIGLHQLNKANWLRSQRSTVSRYYHEVFAQFPDFALMHEPDGVISSWHLYPIHINHMSFNLDRDEFILEMRLRGVDCRVQWRPLHEQPYFISAGWRNEHCPVSSRIWPELVSLPIYATQSMAQIKYVTQTVVDIVEKFS